MSEGFTTDDSKSGKKRSRRSKGDTPEEVDILSTDAMIVDEPTPSRVRKKHRASPVEFVELPPNPADYPIIRISFLLSLYLNYSDSSARRV